MSDTPPEVRYCPTMLGPSVTDGPHGRISMSVGCGFPLREDGTCTNERHQPTQSDEIKP